jgi:hypothetical protein
MNEHIIFKQDDDGRIIKILPSGYDDENMLKRLIKEYPTLLPTPTTSSERIFTLTDEYPIDVGGSIDLLCVDNEGNIYIVETKLQKNSDRRTIIAQLLDYASQIAKESFDTFKRKIEERTGESIYKILGEDTDIVDSIKQSLDEKRFVLIVCMDNIEQRLKDVIIHLNRDWGMDIFGLELNKYYIEGHGEVFVPIITPPPEMNIASTTKPRRIPITFDELIKIYKDNGLEAEILQIIDVFKKMEEKKYDNVQIRTASKSVNIDIGRITIWISSNPNREHGVYVFDASLYDKVYELGQTLGLQVRKGTSSNFSKIIYFNGIDGIRSVAGKIQNLIEGLIKIVEDARYITHR